MESNNEENKDRKRPFESNRTRKPRIKNSDDDTDFETSAKKSFRIGSKFRPESIERRAQAKRDNPYPKKNEDSENPQPKKRFSDKTNNRERGGERTENKRESQNTFRRSAGNDGEKKPFRKFDGEKRSFGRSEKPDFNRNKLHSRGENRNSDKPYRKLDQDRGGFKNKEKPDFKRNNFSRDNENRNQEKPYKKEFGENNSRSRTDRPNFSRNKFQSGKSNNDFGKKPFGTKPFERKDAADYNNKEYRAPKEKTDRNFDGEQPSSFKSERSNYSRNKFSDNRNVDSSNTSFRKKEGEKPFYSKNKNISSGSTDKRKQFKKKDDSRAFDPSTIPYYQRKRYDSTSNRFEPGKRAFGTDRDREGNTNENEEEYDSRGENRRSRNYDEIVEIKEEKMPLNKYVAHSGACGRREAANLVKDGKVIVNGTVVLDPGYKVKEKDIVTMEGKKLIPHDKFVYILLNKPTGYITTTEDPVGRQTVMELVVNSGVDRLYPVGRLDRNTSGLLLLTNDGELTQKLSHPSYEIRKVYHVVLDKPLTKEDYDKIVAGLNLEDGLAKVDDLSYLDAPNELGLEIHIGRNRIVRRIFESLDYKVEKLDRVIYAGLTKKNLPRKKWRYLSEKEVIVLKHFKN